ncbi:uncharacterized protein LOC105443096 [Strongylocentrotus purpuratus]|uniref:Protein kinase domain-containing protein n=1 Tax=Strongylocentrotus purpuratus TaxID=7668 RepID=A0A7M7NPM1_STRPU|nr:uncharacterized protein LOC105443096 [Strongylocentrotus purpuratus]
MGIFLKLLVFAASVYSSLQKDKAILERQIIKLKDGSEAANRMVKEMSQKNKEMANGRKEAEREKKQAEGEKAKAEREKVKAEKEKVKAEKLMKEMEKKMKLEERKRGYVERLNQVLLEKLCHMQQDIAQKTDDIAQKTDDIALNTQIIALKNEQISQLKGINDKLQEITDLRLMREAKTNVDRVVIACLNFVSPQELAIQDLMSFNHSSASGQTILEFVGKGGYGEVMLGRLNGEKDPVAIKRALVKQNLTAELEESDRKRRNVRYEKEAQAGLVMSTSPYFPRFLGTVMINGDHCLVTEFIGDKIQGKSYVLYDAIIPRKGCDPEPDVQKWNLVAIGEDIIRGVMALHGRSLLHNDIKDDNVLLEYRKNRWVAVIIDLGMVSIATYPYFSGSNGSMSTHAKGYFIHTAPEVLKGCATSVASDVYSVGIILDCIGGFIKDDSLRTLGDMCCKEDPKDRPGDMEEMLPGVVHIKEKHMTVARLAGELLEADTEEEQESEEEEEERGDEDFLTDLSEAEEAEGEKKEGDAEVEDERRQEGLEEEVWEEGQVEEEGDDAWLLHNEGEEPNGEEVQRGAEGEADAEVVEDVAEEDRGEAKRHQEVVDEAEEEGREEGNEAGDGEAEHGDAGQGVAGEEALQGLAMRNDEGMDLAVEALHPNAEEAEQGGEELMLEDGEEGANEEGGGRNDGEVIEEDDGIG